MRVIAATYSRSEADGDEGEFRTDLFYRLHVFRRWCRPLRDLVRIYPSWCAITWQDARRMNRQIETIPSPPGNPGEVLRPGNVRELQNFIERAVILSPGSVPRGAGGGPETRYRTGVEFKLSTAEEAERERVIRAIREFNWA